MLATQPAVTVTVASSPLQTQMCGLPTGSWLHSGDTNIPSRAWLAKHQTIQCFQQAANMLLNFATIQLASQNPPVGLHNISVGERQPRSHPQSQRESLEAAAI